MLSVIFLRVNLSTQSCGGQSWAYRLEFLYPAWLSPRTKIGLMRHLQSLWSRSCSINKASDCHSGVYLITTMIVILYKWTGSRQLSSSSEYTGLYLKASKSKGSTSGVIKGSSPGSAFPNAVIYAGLFAIKPRYVKMLGYSFNEYG